VPYWVGVVPCGADPQYTVPGGGALGSETTRRTAWKVPMSGRIVAVGGHLHGGARRLTLEQSGCNGRTLVSSRPMYGLAGDPVYGVRPLLHEPGPLGISWWRSSTGISVRRGESLIVGSHYEGSRPHMRVMGIAHVYLAPGAASSTACAPLPSDAEEPKAAFSGRLEPPTVRLTLARVGSDGAARAVGAPRSKVVHFKRSATVEVKGFEYRPAVLSIAAGGRVRWHFRDDSTHDVTLVTGPTGFASPWTRRGGGYTRRFTTPGAYRLQCSLHPTVMSQLLRVRARGSASKPR